MDRRPIEVLTSLGRHLRDPGFRRDWLLAAYRRDRAGRAPELGFWVAYPEAADLPVELGETIYGIWNMDPFEQWALGALVRIREPHVIFEIGTFDGATTLTLANNAPEAEIFTLDLPEDDPRSAVAVGATHRIGHRFHGKPQEERITQLWGNSHTFDYTPWHGRAHLVLIDADHDYEAVRQDTRVACELLAMGGLIVWDDYTPAWAGAVRAVDETGLPVIRIARTGLAVYDPSRRPIGESWS